jgi:rare lipoprotein A
MTVATLHLAMIGTGAAKPDDLVGSIGPIPSVRYSLPPDLTLVGMASFYDDPGETASGEQYDPNAFTAAAQLRIRNEFGGIKFGRLYRAAYGVGEYEGKKIILKFNDVGPLKPGRKFDLSRAAMTYFDGLEKGLLPGFKVTPLPLGPAYPAGPITDEQLTALLMGNDETKSWIADEKQTPAAVAALGAEGTSNNMP